MKRLIPLYVALVLFGCNGKDSSLTKEEEIQNLLIENGVYARFRNSYFIWIEKAKQLFPEIPDEEWIEIESLANDVYDSRLKANVHLYAQHFSQDEIHEIRQFYKKPTGEKYFDLIEQLMIESENLNQPEATKFEYAFFRTIHEFGHSRDDFFGTQTSAVTFAGDPDLPKKTYPVEGISFGSYSNMCQSIVRQLPDEAKILLIDVITTDKIIGVITAEPAHSQTNAIAHVFTNDEKNWKHTRSHSLGKCRSRSQGLTGEDIKTLLALLQPRIVGNERILSLRNISAEEAYIHVGGRASSLGGEVDGFEFKLEDNKWILKIKSLWIYN